MSKEFVTTVWNGCEIRFVKQEWDDLELTWVNKVLVVAKDVCTALGVKQPNKALKSLPDSYHFKWEPKNGKDKPLEVLTEKGLYKLIFASSTPEAEAFQDWVMEVIQTMRSYSDLYYWQTLQMMDEEKQKGLMELLDLEMLSDHPTFFGKFENQEIPFIKQQGRWFALFDEAVSIINVDPDLLDDRFASWCDLEGYDADELLLSEEGIYQALLLSETEEGRKFQDWVYALLKTIRFYKGYSVPEIMKMIEELINEKD